MKKIAILLIGLAFTSCSHRMVGTWNIDKYETSKPGSQGAKMVNVGEMEFNKNEKGKVRLDHGSLGLSSSYKTNFNWKWTDKKYVSITDGEAEFSKTWIIIENKRKHQKWKSTDGGDRIQVLELSKK